MICPNCGENISESVAVCEKCGYSLEIHSEIKSASTVRNKIALIGSIVFAGYCLFGNILMLFDMNAGYYDVGGYIVELLYIAAGIFIVVGFCVRKSNKFVGIGFLLTAITDFAAIFLISSYVPTAILYTALHIALTIVYCRNNKKIWFLPIIVSIVLIIVKFIFDLSWSFSFGEDDLLTVFNYVFGYAIQAVGCVFYSLNAKFNWNVAVSE